MKPKFLCVKREIFTDKSTVSKCYFDGKYQCYALEDTIRRGPKVPGETAIPGGTYKVAIAFSGRYEKPMPYILDVPNFSHIMIHCGNTPEHTRGCILVGETTMDNFVGNSKAAFDKLYPKIVDAVISTGLMLEIG